MATLFVTHPGQVVAFTEIGALPLTVFLEGWQSFPAFRAAITQISGQSMGSFQFLHTLKQFIYVYVFGERIGEMTIGGMLFSESCTGGGAQTGVEQIADYYNRFRIARYGTPLTIQIGTSGSARVRGFLTGMRIDVTDPQHQLGQFALRFNTLPPEAERNS